MCETKVMKLMEKSSFQLIDKDHDFIMIDYYRTCGFKIGIGVNPFSKLGYGAIVWSTALGLCQYFEKERIHFSDKKVIELGAGTGMLSILAALLDGEQASQCLGRVSRLRIPKI
ncbi:EEF1A lysine methyltransferase 3-like [Scyliorhinus torazame]|uniref:EEF1A lysine methyltransferase 3-like n=1 Tax=Scyliorhinus torazame TaxID=75743 RepID=UPI003B58BEF0